MILCGLYKKLTIFIHNYLASPNDCVHTHTHTYNPSKNQAIRTTVLLLRAIYCRTCAQPRTCGCFRFVSDSSPLTGAPP